LKSHGRQTHPESQKPKQVVLIGEKPSRLGSFRSLWWVLLKVIHGQQQVTKQVSTGSKNARKELDQLLGPVVGFVIVSGLFKVSLNLLIQALISSASTAVDTVFC